MHLSVTQSSVYVVILQRGRGENISHNSHRGPQNVCDILKREKYSCENKFKETEF